MEVDLGDRCVTLGAGGKVAIALTGKGTSREGCDVRIAPRSRGAVALLETLNLLISVGVAFMLFGLIAAVAAWVVLRIATRVTLLRSGRLKLVEQ